MNKTIITLATVVATLWLATGCSATWEGVKSDTSDVVDATKKSIHEATR